MRLKIYSCHHKRPSYFASGDMFMPIWTGGDADPAGRWLTDLDGLNLHASASFNEMRQQFYVWRNLMQGLDYIGFEHYRRLFLLDPLSAEQCSARYPHVFNARRQLAANALLWLGDVDVATFVEYLRLREEMGATAAGSLQRWIGSYDIILPRRYVFAPVDVQWRQCGLSDEIWQGFIRSVRASAFWRGREDHGTFGQIGAHFCNVFLMRTALFDEYMGFWSEVMFNVQGSIDPTTRDLGFLSERLFSYWVLQKQIENPLLKVAEVPFLLCKDFDGVTQVLNEQHLVQA